jgi:hypothetical protein
MRTRAEPARHSSGLMLVLNARGDAPASPVGLLSLHVTFSFLGWRVTRFHCPVHADAWPYASTSCARKSVGKHALGSNVPISGTEPGH